MNGNGIGIEGELEWDGVYVIQLGLIFIMSNIEINFTNYDLIKSKLYSEPRLTLQILNIP